MPLPLHARQACVNVCVLAALLLLAIDVRASFAEPPPNVAKPAAAPTLSPEPSECVQRLKDFAAFTRLPAIAGPGECGAEDLVKLEAVLMPDRSRVVLTPPAVLRCTMAEGVAQFVRSEVGPAAAELGAPLAAVVTADAYDCRNRNRAQAAKLSEHARANALDISAVRLANRTTHSLTGTAAPEAFRARMREAACRWFTTVLGPGSDAYHNEHIHLDRAERSRGYRLCQWDTNPPVVPIPAASVPLPPPKPVALRDAKPAGGSRGK
jgi:hypothetical protein